MDYFNELGFKTPKQARTKRAVDDIVEAIEKLAISENLENATSRKLAQVSGYPHSSLFNYFGTYDRIFLYVFLRFREKAINELEDIINDHPENATLSDLITNLVDCAFERLNKPPRKVLVYFFNKFLKTTGNTKLIQAQLEILILPCIIVAKRDLTGTIPNLSEHDLRFRWRALQAIIGAPFFDDIEIAGTEEHRSIVHNLAMSIFSQPANRMPA